MKSLLTVSEIINYLSIILSPLILGLGLGVYIYFQNPTTFSFALAVFFAVLGLIIGIAWAVNVSKRKGATAYLSELDTPSENLKNHIDKED